MREESNQQLLSLRDDDDSQAQPKKWLTKKVWDVYPYTLLHTKDWMKSFSSFNLCVWKHVWAQVCIFQSVVAHLMDLLVCVHTATTMCPYLLILMLSMWVSSLILCLFFSPFIFCVCEDATVTHKVSIVKKEKEKKKKLHHWVCLQYSFDICC